MKNWFKYILITTVFMFIGFNGVEADNPTNTCEYKYKDGTITFTAQKAGNWAEIKYGGRLTPDIEWMYNSAENTWASHKCPTYVLYKTSGANKLYGSYDASKLDALAKKKNFKTFEIVGLYKVNGVEPTSKNDPNVFKCCYGSNKSSKPCEVAEEGAEEGAEYIFHINKKTETVDVEDSQSAGHETYKPSYEEFKTGCPSKIYKSYVVNSNSGKITYQYSTEEDIGATSSAKSYLIGSENDTFDTSKAKIDYADSCDDAGETVKLLKQVYTLLRYLIPVIIIGLGIVDFIKVVATGEDKAFKEVWSKFVKRIIIGIVILILPAILSLVINLSGITDTYGVDPNNIFCILK